MTLPWDGAASRRALLLALAALLAFSAASLLHVHNAYWAAMPVWVISQPARGVLLERAVFRIIGTLVGAGAGLALLHAPVPPLVKIALLALWIAGNAGAAHLLRGVHGYGALLAGVTGALVVIPALLSPVGALALAVARVDCTLIGVVVGSAVMAFQTPESPLAEFYDEVRAVSADAVAYAARVLRGEPEDDGREERRILGEISALEAGARTHAAGRVDGYRRLGDVDMLVVGSLSTMAAAQAVRDARSVPDAALVDRLEAIATHLRTAWTRPFQGEEGRLPACGDPGLQRLDAAIRDIIAADQALSRPDRGQAYAVDPRTARLAPHREWILARRTGALAFSASFAAVALARALHVPSLGLAALGVCIFVMVLGTLPLPQLVAGKLITGVATGVLAALVYRLAVQPAIASPAGLILSLVPFLLVGGFFRAHPRLGAAGIDFNMCFLLASQAGMPASHDTARIFLDSGALVASAGLMAGLFILLPRRVHHQAVDAVAVIRRDLQRILESAAVQDPGAWRAQGSRQVLRLALHLGRAREAVRRWPRGLLAALNLGQAMIDLRAEGMPEPVRALLAGTLRRQIPPAAAVPALAALAASGEARTRQLTLRLAATLDQASDLLTYSHRE